MASVKFNLARAGSYAFNSGDMEVDPEALEPLTNGYAGKLRKEGGVTGVYGIVAYDIPNSSYTIVFYVQMPYKWKADNEVWVSNIILYE